MSSEAGVGTGARRKAPPPPARKSSAGQQQGYDELKLKFLTADRNYENLKQLARKALGEFDELKTKYTEECKNRRRDKDELLAIQKSFQEAEDELEKFKTTSALAFDQYGKLSEELETESAMREKAETYATEVMHENKVLRRASISIKKLEKDNPLMSARLEQLTLENSRLVEENADLHQTIDSLHVTLEQSVGSLQEKENVLAEKEQHLEEKHDQLSEATTKIASLEQTVQNQPDPMDVEEYQRLKRMSEIAMEELQSLGLEVNSERERRQEAEENALKVKSELHALQRQSLVLMEQATDNQQLQEALTQIDQLQKELVHQRESQAVRERELEEELHHMQESSLAEENKKLQEKLSVLSGEVESWETKTAAAEAEIEELKEKISSLESAVQEVPAPPPVPSIPGPPPPPPPPPPALHGGGAGPPVAPPPPPPPPPPGVGPPPPPPPPGGPAGIPIVTQAPLLGLASITSVTLKKVSLEEKKEEKVDPMAEMLQRIRTGNVALRKVESKSPKMPKSGKGDVMAEMAKLLATRGGRRPPVPIPKKESTKQKDQMSNELFQRLKKRRAKQGEDMPDAAKTAEAKADMVGESSPKMSAPEKTPKPQEVEQPTEEATSAKEEEEVETQDGTQDGTQKTMSSARISISSLKERISSLSEAVKVSTTVVPAQVQPLESKGRVSIPDAFQPKELSPPPSDRDSRSPSVERARKISGAAQISEPEEPDSMPPVFEETSQKIEPTQTQAQEGAESPPVPPHSPPENEINQESVEKKEDMQQSMEPTVMETREEQQPEVPTGTQEQDPVTQQQINAESRMENEEENVVSLQNEEQLSQTHDLEGGGIEEPRDSQTAAVNGDSLNVVGEFETKANVQAGSQQVAADHVGVDAESVSPNGDVNEN